MLLILTFLSFGSLPTTSKALPFLQTITATDVRGEHYELNQSPPPTGDVLTEDHFDTEGGGSFPLPSWAHHTKLENQHSLDFAASGSNAPGTFKQTRKLHDVEFDWKFESSSVPIVSRMLVKGKVEYKLTVTAGAGLPSGYASSASKHKKKAATSATAGQISQPTPTAASYPIFVNVSASDYSFYFENGTYTYVYSKSVDEMKNFISAGGIGRNTFATAKINLSPKITSFAFTGYMSPSLDFVVGTSSGFPVTTKDVWVDCFTNLGVIVADHGLASISTDGGWCVAVDDGPVGVPSYVVKVNPQDYLKKAYTVIVPSTGRPVLNINFSDFYFGDLNGNNVINQADIDLVQEAFGISTTDVRWSHEDVSQSNPRSASYYDFNHDGVVNSADVAFVSAHIGQSGD